jgi:hypothetical protein
MADGGSGTDRASAHDQVNSDHKTLTTVYTSTSSSRACVRALDLLLDATMRHAARPIIALCCVFVIGGVEPVPAAAQTPAPPATSQAVQQEPRTAAAAPASPSIRNVIVDAIQDFRQLPSWPNAAILTAGGIGALTAHAADHGVTNAMAGTDVLGGVLRSGETIGGARTQLAAALATYTAGRLIGSPRTAVIGADLIRAQIVTQSLTAAIKMSVGRTRPDGTQY